VNNRPIVVIMRALFCSAFHCMRNWARTANRHALLRVLCWEIWKWRTRKCKTGFWRTISQVLGYTSFLLYYMN